MTPEPVPPTATTTTPPTTTTTPTPPATTTATSTTTTTTTTTSSLHHSLLGPSLLKAGQDGVDQAKVSEIIYNASKGSKFFEHEQRRDAELTKRIDELLVAKAELEKGDVDAERRVVDAELASLERSRDLSQTIVHVDCDAFYASVEELSRPELKSVPMAVGGGVLTTCNYTARQFGVRSGMAGHIAKKICPQLVLVPLNFEKYAEKASEVREVLARYDAGFEAGSSDEAFLNVTKYLEEHLELTPEALVERIRAEVLEHAKISVSAGIGPNTKIAKIGSNVNKPNGQFRVANTREAVMSSISPLAVRKINGIGRVLERSLAALGITTCASIYPNRHLLRPLFGSKTASFLLSCHLGLGRTTLYPAGSIARKSIGTETTFRALSGAAALREKLRHVSGELAKELAKKELAGRTLVLKVKLDTYRVLTRQRCLGRGLTGAGELYANALPLLGALEKEEGGEKMALRLMGLRVTQLVSPRKGEGGRFFGPVATPEPEQGPRVDEEGWEVWPPDDQSTEVEGAVKAETPIKDETSADAASEAEKEMEAAKWTCPICARPQPADDAGFNSHVDFCLSRAAIRDAVQETRAGVKRNSSGAGSAEKRRFFGGG
ncbi:hypothetical protein EDC01DRAFT_663371 [Geopyxis carbonaria]|nr:hypothetical protein EDC01DRAFT_663371 [Geopyxis carbonaria]